MRESEARVWMRAPARVEFQLRTLLDIEVTVGDAAPYPVQREQFQYTANVIPAASRKDPERRCCLDFHLLSSRATSRPSPALVCQCR